MRPPTEPAAPLPRAGLPRLLLDAMALRLGLLAVVFGAPVNLRRLSRMPSVYAERTDVR